MLRSMLLCVCLLQLIRLGAAIDEFNSPQESLRRSAEFKRGKLETSRQLPTSQAGTAAASRQLLPSHVDDAQQVWLLGLGTHHDQHDVFKTLKVEAGQLLHAVPGEEEDSLHWLVRCSEAAVNKLLAAHQHLTVAAFPAVHKRAQSIDLWQDMTMAFKKSGKWPATLQDSPKQLQRYLTPVVADSKLTASVIALLPKLSDQQITTVQASIDQQVSVLLQQQPQCGHHQLLPMRHALRVTTCMQLLSDVALLLSELAEVTWVELEPKMVLQDLYANVAGQAPQTFSDVYPAPNVQGGITGSAAMYPYWAAGMDGTGEVVGVVDSGADMDSCYLWDPNFTNYTQYSKTFFDGPPVMQGFQSDTHRKVAMYVFLADKTDSIEGHGTHVSTAIVGAPYGVADPVRNPDQATGVAPNARLAMFDLGSGANQVDAQLLVTQGGLAYNKMYDVLAQSGARVMSNSWGLAGGESSTTDAVFCSLFDAYTFDNPDQLLVFAAGNDGGAVRAILGGIAVDPRGTVSTPGACKNTLTVGATNNFLYKGLSEWTFPLKSSTGQQVALPPNQFLGAAENGQLWFTDSTTNKLLGIPRFIVNLPGYDSSMFPLEGKNIPVVAAQPADGCSALDPATFAAVGSTPAAVLFKRTGARCNLTDAAHNVLTNSQVFAAFAYYDNDIAGITADNFSITAVPGMDGKPGAVVWKQLADFMQSAWSRDGTAITVTWQLPDSTGVSPIENLAAFSSYGSPLAFQPKPRADVFKKPDLVAPGYTLAAKSDGTYSGVLDSCNVFTLQGTSMATPQVAGAALLVRQYFLKGFYPLGAPSNNTHEPSGPLIKAMLIAGTVAMQGVSEATQAQLATPPDPFQGFGRMDLSSSLPLADDKLGWGLQVIDQAQFTTTGDSHTYTINTIANDPSKRPLVVVLVWNDWPAFGGATSSIINNLDLLVQEVGGTTTYYPNGLSGPESVNNVEKTYISNPAGKQYKVTVAASRIATPDTAQPYSLVVLGSITNALTSQFNPGNGAVRTPPAVASRAPPPSDASSTAAPPVSSTIGNPSGGSGSSAIRLNPRGNSGGSMPSPSIFVYVMLLLLSACMLNA